MRSILPKNLLLLAERCPKPLYVVGGSVRDFLAGFENCSHDWDICAPISAEEFATIATQSGCSVKAVYKNTGTVKLQDCEGVDYEFSCFRSDKYLRGTHVPVEIFFTNDIMLDAKRRDFTANAIYFDITSNAFVDPLDGIKAVSQKRLTTVDKAEKVFGEDGLRLMRLARQAAQLGFSPDADCLLGATQNAALIKDISPERIFTELSVLLVADQKYNNIDGPYHGLRLLEQIGVLAHIFPELALGKDMAQRADFHKYDVLEHSLRAVKYADVNVRLAALLHDVGKPFCKLRDGNSYAHPQEGAAIATQILMRLKAPKKMVERVHALVELHMYDFDCNTSENKLRRFFVFNFELLEDLLKVKQADFSACADVLSVAPTCKRWKTLLAKMQSEKVPFTYKQLAVTGKDILALNIPPQHVSLILKQLLAHTAVCPQDNDKLRLLKLAVGFEKSIR